QATHRVRGVVAVANDIEVRLPSTVERIDSDIAAAAVRALEWDAFVPVDKVEVTVSNGWVTPKGEVEWEFQRRTADRAVRRLTGRAAGRECRTGMFEVDATGAVQVDDGRGHARASPERPGRRRRDGADRIRTGQRPQARRRTAVGVGAAGPVRGGNGAGG